MTASEFVNSIGNFGALSATEQIKRFGWFLAFHCGKANFTGADITKCFDQSKLPRPSSISPFLKSLAQQKPPFLRRRGHSYDLTRHAHDTFDSALGQRPSTIAVQDLLRALPEHLPVECERVYLEEALICFQNRALRAAIVMTWNLAYDHLCNVLLSKHLAAFNLQLPKSFPRAEISVVTNRDDFETLKESQVLQVAKSANLISGSVYKILKEKLDRRNIAAHPSGVSISQVGAEDFILDLVNNVVLKF
jgi:hypothetical protein